MTTRHTTMRVITSHRFSHASGFSLVEMAVVLLILGILMSGVIVAISETTGNARRSATLAQLRQIEDALYGFAQSQGRLPCPATVVTSGYENGTAAACATGEGFLPSATLGLFGQTDGNGLLVDAWQNPFHYAVVRYGSAGNFPDFTDQTSIANFFRASTRVLGTGQILRICSNLTSGGGTCVDANVITDTAPAIVYSRGANWSSSSSAYEAENTDGDSVFVSTAYNETQFDDQLVWLSPYVMFNRLVSAGKLP